MSFGGGSAPPAPVAPPPAPTPPTQASATVSDAGYQAQRAAQAAAGGMGFGDTLKTSSLGAAEPNRATKNLLGG